MTAVLGVLAVAAVVVGVFGLRVLLALGEPGVSVAPGSPSASPAVSLALTGAAADLGGRARPTAPPGRPSTSGQDPSGSAGGGVVVVDVVGQVRHPVVATLPVGSRVRDAVQAAGGALPGADLSAINSARLLTDGEQVRVPEPGEVLAPSSGGGPGSASGNGSGSGSAPGSAGAGGLVNLNTADLTLLDTLPGVGPVLAQRILDWRTQHQRFTSVDELAEVSGIGEKLLAQLRPKVTV